MRCRLRRGERGIALLEAMLAIVLLATAGTTVVILLEQALCDERELRVREATLASANRVLAATALLTRADLDRRLGQRPVGEFLVEVQRPRPTLYRLAVREAWASRVELLVTIVYRPGAGP